MILAIHGGMAVGKTTLLNNLKLRMPDLNLVLEEISSVLDKTRGLNKDVYDDFMINQILFIQHEIDRFKNVEKENLVIMDYSIEEVIFHTVMFQKLYHPEWKNDFIEDLLIKVKPYNVDRILFLCAKEDVLKNRKQLDKNRHRKSFDHYLEGIHLYKEQWFKRLGHVDFLDTSTMTEEDVLEHAIEWLVRQEYGD